MASLQEILEAREQRWQRQQELLEHFKNPLILFSMNIPGPEKDSPLIRQTFALGDELIRGQLTEDFFNSNSPLPAPLKWAMKNQVMNTVHPATQ